MGTDQRHVRRLVRGATTVPLRLAAEMVPGREAGGVSIATRQPESAYLPLRPLRDVEGGVEFVGWEGESGLWLPKVSKPPLRSRTPNQRLFRRWHLLPLVRVYHVPTGRSPRPPRPQRIANVSRACGQRVGPVSGQEGQTSMRETRFEEVASGGSGGRF